MTDDRLADRADDERAYETRRSLTSQPPENDAVVSIFEELRQCTMVLTDRIYELCPYTRERSLAITNVEQALMWAIKAIALHQSDALERAARR
jgi:hypothetical protein